jgi:hypothetical protein
MSFLLHRHGPVECSFPNPERRMRGAQKNLETAFDTSSKWSPPARPLRVGITTLGDVMEGAIATADRRSGPPPRPGYRRFPIESRLVFQTTIIVLKSLGIPHHRTPPALIVGKRGIGALWRQRPRMLALEADLPVAT